jgi:hypothetical protein
LKTAYRERPDRLSREGANTIDKKHFTSLYAPARELAFKKRNILARWAESSLYPFNSERVLRHTSKLGLQVDEVKVRSHLQDERLRTPQTPITPVTAEAASSMHSLIQRDALTLDETSIQRLLKHVKKLANAVQMSFAERALLRDQIDFLSTMNDEAKRLRSTKSFMVEKAKVMSYEDLEAARRRRAAKEQAQATAGKRKRSRKCKSPPSKAEEEEEEEDEDECREEAVAVEGNCSRKCKRAAILQESSKAPVARMTATQDTAQELTMSEMQSTQYP